jgi:SAM-dependent methyltransferase
MATENRWKKAQSYEQAHWQGITNKLSNESGEGLSWYTWRAENLMNNLSKAFQNATPDLSDANILEVGSGPVGLVSGMKVGRRVATDPLMDFYDSQPSLTKFRDPNVKFVCTPGEELPFEDQFFDMVVIENVIDHVQNVHGVMAEIYRVLKPDGILYLTVNCHPLWGYFLHEIVSAMQIDKGHPHTFTLSKIRRLLDSLGFKLYHEEWEDYRECRSNDWKSDSTRGKLKAASGLSEFLFTSVNRKVPK